MLGERKFGLAPVKNSRRLELSRTLGCNQGTESDDYDDDDNVHQHTDDPDDDDDDDYAVPDHKHTDVHDDNDEAGSSSLELWRVDNDDDNDDGNDDDNDDDDSITAGVHLVSLTTTI